MPWASMSSIYRKQHNSDTKNNNFGMYCPKRWNLELQELLFTRCFYLRQIWMTGQISFTRKLLNILWKTEKKTTNWSTQKLYCTERYFQKPQDWFRRNWFWLKEAGFVTVSVSKSIFDAVQLFPVIETLEKYWMIL